MSRSARMRRSRLPRPLHRPGERRHGVGEESPSGSFRWSTRFLALRLPEGPLARLRPARLPVGLAAGPRSARVPLLAAERAADGLLSARLARPRGAAARDRGRRRPTSNESRALCVVESPRPEAATAASAWATWRGCAWRRWSELLAAREAAVGLTGASPSSPPAVAPVPPRLSCWPGRGRAIRWPTSRGGDRRGASPCGSSGWPRRAARSAGGTQLALPLEPARLRLGYGALNAWDSMLADYRHDRSDHPAPTRWRCCGRACRRMRRQAASWKELVHGTRVRVGGLVVAATTPGNGGRVLCSSCSRTSTGRST